MMTYQVHMSPHAERDLYEAALWWSENRSTRQATKWLAEFQQILQLLRKDPDRFPAAPEADTLGRDIRQITFGVGRKKTHRAVFVIKPNEVRIHAIRQLAQDWLTADDF